MTNLFAGPKARKIIAQGKRDEVRAALGYVPKTSPSPVRATESSLVRTLVFPLGIIKVCKATGECWIELAVEAPKCAAHTGL